MGHPGYLSASLFLESFVLGAERFVLGLELFQRAIGNLLDEAPASLIHIDHFFFCH
jgi:hypothetical protein